MSNFIAEYLKGQSGGNKGLPLGPGLEAVSKAINGLQKGMMIGVAASPKVGKSTFTDYAFVIQPYLSSLITGAKVKWTYFSFEMDRITKEFDFASFFLYHDYGINLVILPEGITVNGEHSLQISSSYLRGRVQDDNEQIVKVDSKIFEFLQVIYEKRIVPMFGRYDEKGMKISSGVIDFIEQKENPTGLRNKLLKKAEEDGSFIYQEFVDKEGQKGKKIIGYTPKDPTLLHCVVTDTIRKIPKERGYNMKETIDKYLEYTTEIRNQCQFTFIHIIHLNRSMADVQRMKMLGDMLYPTPEDIKDTGLIKIILIFNIFFIYLYMVKIKIYCLYEPHTCKIRYIGRTKVDLRKRLTQHISKAKNATRYNLNPQGSYKTNWINSLLKNGIRPRIRLLTIVEGWEQSHQFEKELIQKHLLRHKLVNGDDRGPGGLSKNISESSNVERILKIKSFYANEDNKKNFYNKVYVYNLEGILVNEYQSVKFIEQHTGISRVRITNHMNRHNSGKIPCDIEGYFFSHKKYDVYPYIRLKNISTSPPKE